MSDNKLQKNAFR